MSGRKQSVLALGEILIDLISTDGAGSLKTVNSLEVRPGGAPANASVALARLGVPSAFCGVVGKDPFGERLLETLDAECVDRSWVRRAADCDTTLAFAWKDERGDGDFRILRMADAQLEPGDVDRANIADQLVVIVGSVSLSAEPSRSAIRHAVDLAVRNAVPIGFDVNIRSTLWESPSHAAGACEALLHAATLVKLSVDDGAVLFPNAASPEAIIRALQPWPVRFAVVTDGARGAWFGSRRDDVMHLGRHIPAFAVDSVDPTGAGDAFTAAIVSRLIDNRWSALTADDVRFAAAAGALATTRRGAMAGLPTSREIAAFLESNDDAE